MAKTKNPKKREHKTREPEPAYQPPTGSLHVVRETVESIVIAFVLAFLFRTFEAEAFVIPTGSMSPSLQGRHKDCDCSECGYRFRISASEEESDDPRLSNRDRYDLQVVGGVCPMCRQVMPMRSDLKRGPDGRELTSDDDHPSYPGDRILVNKYGYFYSEPERWDVIVFKFPGNGEMNYIKRLVGLPGEEIQLYQGDVFTRPLDSEEQFKIQQKPANKVAAMLQPVHDSDYEARVLHQAGWPLRWAPADESAWKVSAELEDKHVALEMSVDAVNQAETQWLRYRHYIPTEDDWTLARRVVEDDRVSMLDKEDWLRDVQPQLILDFNPYNSGLNRLELDHRTNGRWGVSQVNRGMNWVSDLAINADVEVESNEGELLLDLVEGGKHFTCIIDLATGEATMSIEGVADFSPQAKTSVKGAGSYNLQFANVDDQLLLWVDGDLVEFTDSSYDIESVFGERERIMPRTSDDDPADLAPAGIGARGASLRAERLRVYRDIYYIAVRHDDPGIQNRPDLSRSDYDDWSRSSRSPDDERIPPVTTDRQLFLDPEAWPRFLTRQKKDFRTTADQFFVMGDNSPASLDCRLWTTKQGRQPNHPGGPYLDRRLLTGRAVCVFWPHSWGSFPGVKFMPGFPNFGDMRIVR